MQFGDHFCLCHIFTAQNSHFFRILWFFLWLLSIAFGCFLFYATVYSRWLLRPTVHDVYSADFKVGNLYFPTITICSNNKIVKRQVKSVLLTNQWKDLSSKYENFDENFETALTAVAHIELETLQNLNNETITILNDYYKDLPKLLHKASKSLLKLFCENFLCYSILVGDAHM